MEIVSSEDLPDGMHVSVVSQRVGKADGQDVMWVKMLKGH